MGQAQTKSFREAIIIPVNPQYQWGHNPGLQAEYVNPVELNNRTILLANMYSHGSEKLVAAQSLLVKAKTAKVEAERALREFERELLRANPPPSSDRQNSALLQAYVLKTATETDKLAAYRELADALHSADIGLINAQTAVDVWRTRLNNIEVVSTNIQTHLSFFKAEQRHSRSYT